MSSARCKVAGCRRKVHARGMCQKHYDDLRKSKAKSRAKGTARTSVTNSGKSKKKVTTKTADKKKTGKAATKAKAKTKAKTKTKTKTKAKAQTKAETKSKAPAAKSRVTKARSSSKKITKGKKSEDVAESGALLCSVVGCGKPQFEDGYCKAHLKKAQVEEGVAEPVSVSSGEGAADSGDGLPGLTMGQRLALLKKRHEVIKSEIESIHEALESEGDDDDDIEMEPVEEEDGEES